MTAQSTAPSGATATTAAHPFAGDGVALLARLRAELAAQSDKSTQSLLLHECAALEEGRGEEPAAARDYLAAFNADPQFREPLEALVRILWRRKSVKNLGKLLDALTRAASTGEEKARALYERAVFLEMYEQNPAAAREALEEAVGAQPEDATLWLELELAGAKAGDPATRMRALEARAELATEPTWKALLFIELAELSALGGDNARAHELLGAAAALEGRARFRTQLVLEQVGAREDNPDTIARALEGQAELIEEAIELPTRGDANGVPRYLRKPEQAADRLLRASELRRRAGDHATANALLDRAAERLPASSIIARARLVAHEAADDAQAAAEIAKAELDRGASGKSAASLWLRVAEAAALGSDRAGALAALRKALEADPESIPARALELDLVGDGQDPSALANALESLAETFKSEEAKGRAYLLSTYVWGALVGDTTAAKAALSQAGACGVSPAVASRIARSIAALRVDASWYEEATKRLLAQGADASEVGALWLDLGRSRLLRGDDEGAGEAFAKLASLEGTGHAWLGRALGAFAVGLRPASSDAPPPKRSPEALEALATVETDAELARGLALVAALRAVRLGDLGRARARLAELHAASADDVVAAIFLAEVERRSGRVDAAADVLAATAAAVEDRELGAALHLESALLSWQRGDRAKALEAFEAARSGAPKVAGAVLSWALRGVDPDTIDARRRALEVSVDAGHPAALAALERFGLEAAAGDPNDALSALEALESASEGDLAMAAALARLLWPYALEHRAEAERALDRLEDAGGDARSIARAERYRFARAIDQDKPLAVERARRWADADGSLPVALEWIAAAIAGEDRDAEVEARRGAAARAEPVVRAALEASAAIVALLDQPTSTQDFIDSELAPAALTNLELAAPGCDPRRRSVALHGLGHVLGEEAQLDSVALAGWSELASGAYEDARKSFRAVLEARPRDTASWEGVRATSEALGDHVSTALACAQLGALCNDPDRGAEFWETAGTILLDHTDAKDDAEIAFERAFERNPRRDVAFDKLFRAVRSRNEDERLLEIIEKRLDVSEDDQEIGKLYWERARVKRKMGDLDAALAALENVTMLEPDHVGALALSGEICITKGAFSEAAPLLARLATIEEAPKQQRLMSGIAAVDLYENKLGEPKRALEVLVGMHKAGLSNPNVRERLAKVAARAGAWIEATSILETLMQERTTKEGRIEAARLAMAIWRDKIGEAPRAQTAVGKLLDESTDDPEAVDMVLATSFDATFRGRVLARAKSSLLQALARDPTDAVRVDLLSRIAAFEADAGLRQATLGALVTLGRGTDKVSDELNRLDARVAARPQIALDAQALAEIADPSDTGPVAELFMLLGETIALAFGPSLQSLGVTKKDKIEARGGHPLRVAVSEWVGAVGIATDWDLYVGGPDPRGVVAVASETPAIVVGRDVTPPFDAATRSAVAREAFGLRRGIGVVRARDENTVASIAFAAAIEAKVPVQPPPYAIFGEVSRGIHKEIPRRVRNAIGEVCQRFASSGQDPHAWAIAARRSLDRMAVIAAGDVSLVLADVLGARRDQLSGIASDNDRARKLLAFVLSPNYLELRKKLGMGVR